MNSRILIGGHRGLGTTDNANAQKLRDVKNIIPENTVEAFQRAFTDGADFIEFDVVPAKDGLVVTHSARLSDHVFSGTTAKYTTELTVTALSTLTTGHRGAASDRIPTLSAVLAAIAPVILEQPHRFINLEMKEVQNSGLTWSLDEALKYADEIYQVIDRHGLMQRTLFSSFNSANLQALLHATPSGSAIPAIAQLFDTPDNDGKPIYGDTGLACYMAFTPKNVEWALSNMPLAGLNPPVQAFAMGGDGANAVQAAVDYCTKNDRKLPGIYIWALAEKPVSVWKDDWQAALDASKTLPRRAIITDYPIDMRLNLG